jgi:hypothetical protein
MAENDGKVMERAERFFSGTARFSAGARYCGALIDLEFDPKSSPGFISPVKIALSLR